MISLLSDARDEYSRLPRYDLPDTQTARQQQAELAYLEGKPQGVISFNLFHQAMVEAAEPRDRGYPVGDIQVPRPQVLRYLLLSGRTEDFDRQAGPLLHSGIFDMLDGGFFHQANTIDWKDVEFDKPAPENAELTEVFATSCALTGDPESRYAAERTFDSLTGEFTVDNMISSCRIGDEGPMGRSNRSSFAPTKLEGVLPNPNDQAWAGINLGLDPRINPQATAMWIGRIPFVQADRCTLVLDALRRSAPKARFEPNSYADIDGLVVARLISSARLLGSPERLRRALDLYGGLERFRSGVEITHRPKGDPSATLFLSDYLAYADASLQAFLATGREDCFTRGEAVLERALTLFAWRAPGELVLAHDPPGALTPPYSAAPELVDNRKESCTAEAIRLSVDYGRLAGESNGKQLREFAASAVRQFGDPCNKYLGPWAAGFYCAAAGLTDCDYAVVVGPQTTADTLLRLRPVRFVGRASGPVRPDLTRRGAGVYVVRNGQTQGPMSVAEAAKVLDPVLRVE
jgi:uncharacterized protein YyaL (SSP411 family)